MNARIVRRKLMANRSTVFWGRRAYLLVRLPMSGLFVEPPPPKWTPPRGEWSVDLPCGGFEMYDIGQVHGGDPRGYEGSECCFHVEEDERGNGWFKWWEGRHIVERDGIRTETPLSVDIVDAHIARQQWEEEHLHTVRDDEPVVGGFILARGWARSMDIDIVGEDVRICYGVKYFYPSHKLGFCADLRRAIDAARGAGIRAQIVKGFS